MSFYNHYLKRISDVVISVFLLFIFSWLMLLLLLIYLISFNLPFFYHQERIGRNGIPFMLYKFRTLSTLAALPLPQRQFRLGSFLRKFSLDELPQLFHVLKGEMSLVGPRPLPIEYAALFSEKQNQRHQVRPGITGLAQVNGRNSISWKEKLDYDHYYVKHVSFWLDQKILAKTVILLFSFKEDVSLHEKKFTGQE